MSAHELHLSSSCLLAKYGFNDGDMPDDLHDWLDEQIGQDAAHAIDWRPVLDALVREFLIPLIEQPIEVVSIDTCHNPIRVDMLHGLDVTDLWFNGHPNEGMLTPESVSVPYAVVLDRAQRLEAP